MAELVNATGRKKRALLPSLTEDGTHGGHREGEQSVLPLRELKIKTANK